MTNWVAVASLAAAMIGVQSSAHAGNLVTNGSFEQASAVNSILQQNGTPYDNAGPGATLDGWSIGTAPLSNGYNVFFGFIYGSGKADSVGATGSPSWIGQTYLWGPNNPNNVYSNNGLTASSPDGGNFLALDTDSTFSASISQTISGLTVGKTYELSFYVAEAQFRNHDGSLWGGATYGQIQVGFGLDVKNTDLLSIPEHGFSDWQKVDMLFKATSDSQTLSFLGINGPSGLPPAALLDGVSLNAVPEPSSLALSVLGLVGFGALRLRRRSK